MTKKLIFHLQICLFCLLFLNTKIFGQEDTARLVTLGGDVTEIVAALGFSSNIVGRDSTSTYPPKITDIPDLGYLRTLNAEGILSLAPTKLIASSQAGPPEVIEQLKISGINLTMLPEGNSVGHLLERIKIIGNLLKAEKPANRLINKIRTDMEKILKKIEELETKPRVLFLLHRVGGSTLAAGTDTAANALINLVGGTNIISSSRGYKSFSPEKIISSQPQIIMMMDHSFEAMGGMPALANHPIFNLTPAIKENKVIIRDGLLMLGFGPRLPLVVSEIAREIHPKLFKKSD